MAIRVLIKGKKISDCSLAERTVLGVVHTHYVTMFNEFKGIAATGDAIISMRNANASEAPSRVLRDETRQESHDSARDLTLRMAALYFQDLELEIETSNKPKDPPPTT